MVRRLLALLALVLTLGVAATAAPAGAVDNPTYTAPPPATTITTPAPPAPDDEVVTAVKVEAQRSRLAITGSDETGLAVIGGGLLLAGAAVLVVRRRAGAHAA
ncbi:MAG: LPXTG cell wall anchor domain-containing protein [Acidimicrobiales bacterium]